MSEISLRKPQHVLFQKLRHGLPHGPLKNLFPFNQTNRTARMLTRLVFFVCCIVTFSKPHAQPAPVTSGEIYLGLQKLAVLGSVLYIAAHPDDENTRLLTYFAKERLYRTGYLSLTRGDGGQNLIGDEQGIALGLIRTQELLAARRIDGAEQFFTRAFDFGYSKNPEETFTKWIPGKNIE
jgi:hypothetical protein